MPKSVLTRARQLFRRRRFSQVIRLLESQVSRYRNNSQFYALLGTACLHTGDFGGAESYTECKEKTVHNGFTYIWEQASFDPLTADYVCYIHFKFADGSKLKRAFSYHWRLWTMPEIRELLDDAGFSTHHVYWQGTDDDGEASGEFFLADEGENDPAWIAYIVAEP
jgi:hypothetical protein